MSLTVDNIYILEVILDKLQVIKAAEAQGEERGEGRGKERRDAIEKLMVYARNLGCAVDAGGGRIGGINFRYGSIGYAILDVSTAGDIKVYAQPHPNKAAPEAMSKSINDYLTQNEFLNLKSPPVNCHGLLIDKIEDIPISALIDYLEFSLQHIKDTYYKS